ncbi:hypothetical protein LR48_Vigan2427s000100 [Vigna angularis]|nr:hypothetical protein LR48_Vigan2427s000100 [Vigna angularis]
MRRGERSSSNFAGPELNVGASGDRGSRVTNPETPEDKVEDKEERKPESGEEIPKIEGRRTPSTAMSGSLLRLLHAVLHGPLDVHQPSDHNTQHQPCYISNHPPDEAWKNDQAWWSTITQPVTEFASSPRLTRKRVTDYSIQ